jgi:hypothetical protein
MPVPSRPPVFFAHQDESDRFQFPGEEERPMSDVWINRTFTAILICLTVAGLVGMGLGLSGAFSPTSTVATQPGAGGSGGRSLTPLEDRYGNLPRRPLESYKESQQRHWAEYQEHHRELKRRYAAGELLLPTDRFDVEHPLKESDFGLKETGSD